MANENESLIFGPTYQDRCFCESADACGVKDCPRRLTDADKEAIKRGNWLVAMIPKCGKFEQNDNGGGANAEHKAD